MCRDVILAFMVRASGRIGRFFNPEFPFLARVKKLKLGPMLAMNYKRYGTSRESNLEANNLLTIFSRERQSSVLMV